MSNKLSICIPAYNRPLWLRRSLESIIAQNVSEDIEIIISDDSSGQRSAQVTYELLKNWPGQWKYQANQPRLGMAKNWNQSIKLASGEYVILLHDDDFLLANSLASILQKIDQYRTEYPVLLWGVNVVDDQEKVLKKQFFQGEQYLSPKQALIRLLSDSSFVRFPAIVIQRRAFEEVGYFNPVWGEPTDLDMWIRLFSRYGVLCASPITCAYRIHSQALTMGVFNEKTIKTILSILTQVERLTEIELEKCKTTFFHQFILAGAFRKLRRGQFKEFSQIIQLFKLPDLKESKCPLKWIWLRWGFEGLSKVIQRL